MTLIGARDRTEGVIFIQPNNPELSRNEIESLCAKATRGAGLSWGHADDAGFVAGWLHAHGFDGVGLLTQHLTQIDGVDWRDLFPIVHAGDWSAPAGIPLCPIAVGATLSDFCDLPEGRLDQGLSIGPVGYPLLLIPFLARISDHLGCGIVVEDGEKRVSVGMDAVNGNTNALDTPSAKVLSLSIGEPPAVTAPPNYHCEPGAIATLGSFALRTTVPPSERSRADAGAGPSDND